jgi:predicted MPP superfamily phosphohydrolase
MEEADQRYPVILLDHQPYYLEKAASLGVDLQLSGHTHHGQLWPLHHITKAIFTISRGYGKIDGMHAYVSNGVGTWGPPVRVGNRPEIVSLKIHFQ